MCIHGTMAIAYWADRENASYIGAEMELNRLSDSGEYYGSVSSLGAARDIASRLLGLTSGDAVAGSLESGSMN